MIECLGTYQGKNIFSATLNDYAKHRHTKPDSFWLVDNKTVVYGGMKVGEIDSKGYITSCRAVPFNDVIKATIGALQEVKEESRPVKKESKSVQENVAPATDIDEYLKSKKSVDYFFEELKNKEAL